MKRKNKKQVIRNMLSIGLMLTVSSMIIAYESGVKTPINLTFGLIAFGLTMLAAMCYVQGILFIHIKEEKEKLEKRKEWL